MEKATQATTPTASPRTDTFAHAHTVAGAVISELGSDKRPFAVEIEEDFPSGWRVHLKFRETRAPGLLALAELVDVPVTRAHTDFGIHLDAIARIEQVEVRGSALVSPAIAAQLEGEPAPTTPNAADAETPTAQPVPLGASVLAHVPVVTPVQPADTAEVSDGGE